MILLCEIVNTSIIQHISQHDWTHVLQELHHHRLPWDPPQLPMHSWASLELLLLCRDHETFFEELFLEPRVRERDGLCCQGSRGFSWTGYLGNPAEYYKWYFSEHAIAHIDSMSRWDGLILHNSLWNIMGACNHGYPWVHHDVSP